MLPLLLKVALSATAVIAVVDSNAGGYLLKSPAQRERDFPPEQEKEKTGETNPAFEEKL